MGVELGTFCTAYSDTYQYTTQAGVMRVEHFIILILAASV